jgi:phenol 2-monooxygenase
MAADSLKGDSANQAWGVMNVLAVTDFPDIRLKATILSADQGSILIIPREGGYLARIYLELDKLDRDERVANRKITLDQLIVTAQHILHPYTLDVKEVAWWLAYGQRICDSYDDGQGSAIHMYLSRATPATPIARRRARA